MTFGAGHRTGMERLAWIREHLAVDYCATADLVVIEGYSFGSGRAGGTTHAHALGELGGAVRLELWDRGIPYVDVPPASLKKYATGRGNANKEQVLVAAVRRLDYQGADPNEADALWLREMGCDAYQTRPPRVPAAHQEALHAVPWPHLERT